MNCPKCNTPLEDNAEYCYRCGYIMPQKKKKKTGLIVGMSIGGGVLLIAVVCLVAFLVFFKPEKESVLSEDTKIDDQVSTPDIDMGNNDTESNDTENIGSVDSSQWLEGIAVINGASFSLPETTLEKLMESGYKMDGKYDQWVLNGESSKSDIELSDGKHRKIKVDVKNYSTEKACWLKHGLIESLTVEYGIQDGLESPEITFVNAVTGNMTMDEVKNKLGEPVDSDESTLTYKTEDEAENYSATIYFDSETQQITQISYFYSGEKSMPEDDSSSIEKALDSTDAPSGRLDKKQPSEVLKDAEVKIGSNVYQVPLSMKDLSDRGYVAKNGESIINANQLDDGFYASTLSDKGDNYLGACFANPGNTIKKRKNAAIYTLLITGESENVSVAKGMHVGNTKAEIQKAFGSGKKYQNSLQYSYSAKRGVVTIFFELDKKDKVKSIQISVVEKN